MSSSREVTVQKKKDVWEEAGSEFYQESYPSGSKAPNNTHQRRPSRFAIPLPSHTARRGSLLQGRNNKSARRKPTLARNALGGGGHTYNNSTIPPVDANGTTTNMNDIQVAILPDLSEETILNERKTWEELLRIKSMPVPMAQKKQLKAQLTNLPKLRLKGWSHLKWYVNKSWQNLLARAGGDHTHIFFLHKSLRVIELRAGTAIANVFLYIKFTILLNLAISLALVTFIIGPYITHQFIQGEKVKSASNATSCSATDEGGELDLDNTTVRNRFLDCCRAHYEEDLREDANSPSHGSLAGIFQFLGLGDITSWPFAYNYYQDPAITYDDFQTTYPFDSAYVLTGCAIYICCLMLLVQTIATGVKDIIHLKEGEFYKYSNLIFAGWDHYTNDEAGLEFKRRVLRNEMKIALQTEKKKINDLRKSKKERVKMILFRILVNFITLVMIVTAGMIIFYTTLEIQELQQRREDETNSTQVDVVQTIQGFIPSFVISFFNLIFPIMLARLGKLEQMSMEWETALVLLRSLFIRLFSVYAAALAFYQRTYCEPEPGHCTVCNNGTKMVNDTHMTNTTRGFLVPEDPHTGAKSRSLCWETQFADQIYRLIITDLFFKTVLTFIVDPFRRLVKYCFKNKLASRFGTLSFSIVRHSLDVIYIQVLCWMSFHFAPFMPICTVVYCFLIFYIKKFSVLYNCKSVPDTFRTTKTTAVFMAAKTISFVVVLFTYAFIVTSMVPSRECGPFRGKSYAWSAVQEAVEEYPVLDELFSQIGSPGIAVPIALILILLTYYYYSVAQANRSMVETLRHLLILEGHDKQYLFAKLNSLRRKSQSNSPTTDDGATLNHP